MTKKPEKKDTQEEDRSERFTTNVGPGELSQHFTLDQPSRSDPEFRNFMERLVDRFDGLPPGLQKMIDEGDLDSLFECWKAAR